MGAERNIARDRDCRGKADLAAFLARNPFQDPLTLGLFYREKMKAIHAIAPPVGFERILDIGGGRSGIVALLYPDAHVVDVDFDASHASAPCNAWPNVDFVCGDAVRLPFPDRSFDAVTMFDLLEHVPDDASVAREVGRVLRPGGWILVSTPKDTWRYPHFTFLKSICRTEEDLFAEWGHVRRGYSEADLARLFGRAPDRISSFCSPWTAIGHDIAFSRLRRRARKAAWLMLSPLIYAGYALGSNGAEGSEHVAAWQVAGPSSGADG